MTDLPTASNARTPLVPARLLADRYLIERELGSGGMATVYLARDTRHDRNVALKVLKPELAAVIGAARFLAEIKTTANLQNPHILPLHDSGEVDGTVYYVMPFVDGESLRDRLEREKQLPIPEAIRIATDVADALQHAHAHGVIHRDIKPENILLLDGHAVVADFGIALAASSAGSRMTETGMSLGTPQYMSPEQAMGERNLDARTDVYALGCVLYEMLAGQPPFTGPTAQAVVAKVVTQAPAAPSALRATVSPALDEAILTAIQKLPADRFASARDFSRALAEGAAAGFTSTTHPRTIAAAPRPRNRWVMGAMIALLAASICVAVWAMLRTTAPRGPSIYDAALPDSAPMSFVGPLTQTGYGTPTTELSVAANGAFVVYPAMQGSSTVLWRRSLVDAESNPIAGTEGGTEPAISPDGSRIAFVVSNRVMLVPAAGGTARQLLVVGLPASLQWLSPSQLFVEHSDGTRATWLDADAGPIRDISLSRCTFGKWLPEQKQLLCGLSGIVWTLDTAKGAAHIIDQHAGDDAGEAVQGSDFRLVDNRYLVYMSVAGDLSAAPYDARRGMVGRSVALVSGVRREGVRLAQFDIAANGTLAYAPGADAGLERMVSRRSGDSAVALPIEPDGFERFDMSRDRRWLAAVVQRSRMQELRVYNLRDDQSFTWMRAPTIRHALWNRDGTRLLVWLRNGERSAIVYGAPGSASPPDTLAAATLPATVPEPMDFPDDHTVIAVDLGRQVSFRFDPTARPIRFESLPLAAGFIIASPNGKLVCYQAADGRILVTSFPPRAEQVQVAAQGVEPLWLSDSAILYRSGISWYLARVNPTTGELLGRPTLWATDPRFSDTPGWSNRLSQDGGIIYAQGPSESKGRYLRVVPNWVKHMEAAVDSVNR